MRQGGMAGFVGRLCGPRKIISRIATLFLVLAILFFTGSGVRADTPAQTMNQGISPDGTLYFLSPAEKLLATIAIEIADTAESHNRGLMWRTGLDDGMGMLFVFERAQPLAFWMRNTPTALDIIFLSAKKIVINIAENTSPMSDTIYRSQAPAQYVVEVPAGFCRRHQVTPGVYVRWQRLGSAAAAGK